MSVLKNEQHVVVQKRRGFACVFCREEMQPESHAAAGKCAKREVKESAVAGVRTIQALRDVGTQMRTEIKKTKRKTAKAR